MRLAGLPVARLALCRCRASLAVIGFAPARSYAKIFHSVTRRLWTGADNLPQLPQLALKKLGQRKPNEHAMPQLPQPAPTIFNVYRMKNSISGWKNSPATGSLAHRFSGCPGSPPIAASSAYARADIRHSCMPLSRRPARRVPVAARLRPG